MTEPSALYQLLSWMSPAYPTGAFSYSHGLEWAVEDRLVASRDELVQFVAAALMRGGGWVDAVLFAHAWRVADQPKALDEISELASAWRGSAETALEARQQGTAFLQVTRRAWPHAMLDDFADRQSDYNVAHCVVAALACRAHGIAPQAGLHAYLHAFASNLVSAGARLIPLGQSDAQIAIAALAATVIDTGLKAAQTALEDLGTATPAIELCSLRHETQYTRLFRS